MLCTYSQVGIFVMHIMVIVHIVIHIDILKLFKKQCQLQLIIIYYNIIFVLILLIDGTYDFKIY